MGLFSGKEKEEIIAIFDIGSGSVGGALVKFSYTKDKITTPIIISQSRNEIKFRDGLDFTQFVEDMDSALSKTAEDLYLQKKGAPNKIFCVLSSPWYISETKVINESKSEPFVVTSKKMNDLIEKEKASLVKEYTDKYSGTNDMPVLIESICMHSTLNGYIVHNPVGKTAKEININLYVSLSPKSSLDGISKTLSKFFHHIPISYGTYMSSLYTTGIEKYMSVDTALLIAIGGEVTDIGIVSNGILTDTVSFPCGSNSLKRILLESTKLSISEISSSLALLSKDMLARGSYDVLLPGLKIAEEKWINSFKDSLLQLPQNTSLPGSVFMVSDESVMSWFKNVIESEEGVSNIIARKNFSVVTILGKDLLDICKVKEGTCDQFLMVESIAYALLKLR